MIESLRLIRLKNCWVPEIPRCSRYYTWDFIGPTTLPTQLFFNLIIGYCNGRLPDYYGVLERGTRPVTHP